MVVTCSSRGWNSCDNSTLAQSHCLSTALDRAQPLTLVGTTSSHLKALRPQLGFRILPGRLIRKCLALAPFTGQGRDPATHLAAYLRQAREAGRAEAQKSQAQWGLWDHRPTSPQGHRPHGYYFLIKMASYPLLQKPCLFIVSKFKKTDQEKEKLRMTHGPQVSC